MNLRSRYKKSARILKQTIGKTGLKINTKKNQNDKIIDIGND